MIEPLVLRPMQELFRRGQVPIFRAGLIIQALLLGVSAFFIHPSSDSFILRYNAFFGVDILGVWWQVYLVPGMCLILFLSDIALAKVLARRQSFLAAVILLYGSFLVVISGVIATVALISINS